MMSVPFADHLGIIIEIAANGRSHCLLNLHADLLNSNGFAHGGVPFALADTGMGLALKSMLKPGESCVTVELKINYHRPSSGEVLKCESQVVHKGRRLATLESRIRVGEVLTASAIGTFAILASG